VCERERCEKLEIAKRKGEGSLFWLKSENKGTDQKENKGSFTLEKKRRLTVLEAPCFQF
jgi:hypothetical protein